MCVQAQRTTATSLRATEFAALIGNTASIAMLCGTEGAAQQSTVTHVGA